MKKKIAVCGNGWNYDTLHEALLGIREYAEKEDFDIFVFLSFASYSEHKTLMQGELNIYKLMDPKEYDGIIVFSTALNSVETVISICKEAKECGVPVVSIGMELDGISSVCVSNDEGMRELVEHLIEKHNVKRVTYIGGTPDHVDSMARLDVTRKTLEAHGLKLDDADIKYGKWTSRYTYMAVDEVCDSENGLPDAFICANDIMAMAACTELESKGYLVPQDVIVTGFDNCRDGKDFYPALSTVEQNYREIGYKACRIIFDELCGNKETVRELVNSRFACGESCGCKGEKDYAAMHIAYCRKLFKKNSDAKLLEQNERGMQQWLADTPSYSALKETLSRHYLNSHQFEGKGFYICINKEYFEDVMLSEKELWAKGKSSGIETLIALKDDKIIEDAKVNAVTIVPEYCKNEGEQHIYFVMPMHYFENNYGYVVLTDFTYLTNENMLYPYMEKLQQSIRLMRTNLRLRTLHDRDQLTGLYNRFGYENKALLLYRESIEKKTDMMVMFVDINYMKNINDVFGHLHGDNAIRTVAAAIKANVSNDAVPVRFGGDEFLIIEHDCDRAKAEQIRRGILEYLEEKNSEKSAPYDISVSIGFTVTDPVDHPDVGLSEYIRDADRLMYEIKKEMHKKNDRRKA